MVGVDTINLHIFQTLIAAVILFAEWLQYIFVNQ